MQHYEFLARLAQPATSRIVLLVLDGVGDLITAEQPQTALQAANTPNLDKLAARSALGRVVPVAQGVTPGSGPAHLALFGYDPRQGEADIGRGVLEALGLGLELQPDDVAVRGNFATADSEGRLTDRRAGRIPTAEGRRVCDKLRQALESAGAELGDVEVLVEPGEAYRFVLILRGQGLSGALADTDPQKLGVPPLEPRALAPEAESTADAVRKILDVLEAAVADEPQANRLLLRGFSKLPHLPVFPDLYRLRAGCFAGYPLYRGVARACGMDVVPCEKDAEGTFACARDHRDEFDFFFVHIKQTDQAGEDGNLPAKIEVLEKVDAALPVLMELEPDVVAITGDHSTPAPLAAHSWHPVPLLLYSDRCFVDSTTAFDELTALAGHLGTIPSRELMGLLLANAGRLAKFGA